MITDKTKYIELDDIDLYYYDNHNITKPVMIFLHGLGENLESWIYQLDYFNDNYRVVALDFRGHGKTNDGKHSITIAQFASDVLELINALKIDSAHFIGLSMGGIVCQELTKFHQSRMKSLTLCNTASHNTHPNITEQIKWVKAMDFSTMASVSANLCLPKGYSHELYRNVIDMFSHNRKSSYIDASIATMSIDFRNILINIKVPTLVITGALDILTPVDMAKYIHNNIPNSVLNIIPGAGHLSNLEQPNLFNQALANFILRND